MKIEDIKIEKVENNERLLAFATFVLNGCFAVHNARIIKGDNGMFVAMPSVKTENGYKDVCHPINQEFRTELNNTIIEEYLKHDKGE